MLRGSFPYIFLQLFVIWCVCVFMHITICVTLRSENLFWESVFSSNYVRPGPKTQLL